MRLAGWINEWTLTYAGSVAVLLLAIRAERQRGTVIRWRRVLAWLGLAALVALVVWIVIACLWTSWLATGTVVIRGICLIGSAFWAILIGAAFLPVYFVLLFWYACRFGPREGTRRSVVLAALALGMPGALWLAYGYAFPIYELRRSVEEGVIYGGLALVSLWIGLAAPRLIVRRLGPGQLSGGVGPNLRNQGDDRG